MELLFVYGTLLNQEENHMADFLRNHSSYLSRAYMMGELYDVGRFPGGLYIPKSQDKVHGDLLHLKSSKKVWEVLDPYEGFVPDDLRSSLFIRTQATVHANNQEHRAWVYVFAMQVLGLERIAAGDYAAFLRRKYSTKA